MRRFWRAVPGLDATELHSSFRLSPLRNPTLLIGTIAAQGIHLLAMQTPGISTVLSVEPVSLKEWVILLGLALTVFVAIELHKLIRSGKLDPGARHPLASADP